MPHSKEEEREPVRIDGTKCIGLSKSNLAILCTNEDWDEDVWVPQSIIHANSEVYKLGTEGVLVVPRWFAKEKNLL